MSLRFCPLQVYPTLKDIARGPRVKSSSRYRDILLRCLLGKTHAIAVLFGQDTGNHVFSQCPSPPRSTSRGMEHLLQPRFVKLRLASLTRQLMTMDPSCSKTSRPVIRVRNEQVLMIRRFIKHRLVRRYTWTCPLFSRRGTLELCYLIGPEPRTGKSWHQL